MDKFEIIQQIRKGNVNSFTFNGEECNVHRKKNGNFIISRKNGQQGETRRISSTIDLYGIVCYLRNNAVNYHYFED